MANVGKQQELERCQLWEGEMTTPGTLGHGEKGEFIGQMEAGGCGGALSALRTEETVPEVSQASSRGE